MSYPSSSDHVCSNRLPPYPKRFERLELLERFERSLFNESLQKPPAPHAVIIDPGDGATAGFGEVVIALALSTPPAAGKDAGAGKLVYAAVLVSQHEPAIFVLAA